MKQYVWMAMILSATVGVNASENPFELNTNFQKIEQEEQMLLNELQKEAQPLEAIRKKVNNTKIGNKEAKKETVINNTELEKKSNADVLVSEGTAATMPVSAERSREVVEIEKIKAAQDKIDMQRKNKDQVDAEQKKTQEKNSFKTAQEKLAENKISSSQLPKELVFFQMLVDAKTSGEHKTVKGDLRRVLEKIEKEKNNKNYSIEDIKKEFEQLKNPQEAGILVVAYLMSKSIVLQESLDSDKIKEFDEKFKNAFKDKNKTEKMVLEKYPNEAREIVFSMIEDILENGIPKVDMNMKMADMLSTDPTKSEPLQVKMDGHAVKSTAVDINISKEEMEAKKKADEELKKAIAEVD